MTLDNYTATLDQRLARMRETARLAAAFYKGLVEEGVDKAEAQMITAVYAITINQGKEAGEAEDE